MKDSNKILELLEKAVQTKRNEDIWDFIALAEQQGYIKKIYAYSYFIIKDESIADDITSETILKIFYSIEQIHRAVRKVPQKERLAYLSNYIVKIGKTIASKENKRQKAIEQYEVQSHESPCFNELNTSEELGKAISLLSREEQNIIGLRFFRGKSYLDIAKELKLDRYTVRRRIAKAIKHVKRDLIQKK